MPPEGFSGRPPLPFTGLDPNSARMLAGLLFAVQDADDRPGTLAATLPFAGVTLIEYQARLLIGAGASQIVIVVARLTPELLGALARIARRGVSVDTVRSAPEASAKLHPLARLIMLADGLVASEATVAAFAGQGPDMLLVTDAAGAPGECERLGGGAAWAGVARLDARRLGEVAALPSDYDVQSALLRAAGQAGAGHVALLGDEALGHGIERRGAALEARSRAVMMATIAARPAWFDRAIVRPLAGFALPALIRRGLSTMAGGAVAGAMSLAGLGLIAAGYETAGLLATLAGVIAAVLAERLAWLRDEGAVARAMAIGILTVPALAALLLGYATDRLAAADSAQIIAVALVVIAGLAERAASGVARAAWWITPPAALALLALCCLAGFPTSGLVLVTGYAAATLGAAIERLRERG